MIVFGRNAEELFKKAKKKSENFSKETLLYNLKYSFIVFHTFHLNINYMLLLLLPFFRKLLDHSVIFSQKEKNINFC